jgi:hypothetical protein
MEKERRFCSHAATSFVGAFTTPRIAERAGSWTAVCAAYSGVTLVVAVLWQLLVPSSKRSTTATTSTSAKEVAEAESTAEGGGSSSGSGEAQQRGRRAKAVEWRIFRAPAALSTCLCQVADNNLVDTIYLWAPAYFTSALGALNNFERTRLLCCSLSLYLYIYIYIYIYQPYAVLVTLRGVATHRYR